MHVTDADADDSVLIIGEPACPEQYPASLRRAPRGRGGANVPERLPAGWTSALVRALISEDASQAGADARTVLNAMFEKRWRIVHIAGHGMPAHRQQRRRGRAVDRCFLGPDEIRNMRTVPGAGVRELLPSCRRRSKASSSTTTGQVSRQAWPGRSSRLACVASSRRVGRWTTTRRGVRRSVLFVAASRQPLHRCRSRSAGSGVRTKPAREHVGSIPMLRRSGLGLQAEGVRSQSSRAPSVDDFSGIGSATSLRLALERIIVQSKFQGADPATQLANLTKLEELFEIEMGQQAAQSPSCSARRSSKREPSRRDCAGTSAPWRRPTGARR